MKHDNKYWEELYGRNPVAFYDGKGDVGNHTELWRILSWHVGDRHADRICVVLNVYCKLFGLKPSRFYRRPR